MFDAIGQFIPYLFTFVFAVVVIETILSARWLSCYFRTGITIYRRTILVRPGVLQMPAAEQIQAALSDSGRNAPMLVRRIGETRFAFREKLLHLGIGYSPLMRGCITCNPATGKMEVHGYLNWYILAFACSLLLFLVCLPFDAANIVIPVCISMLLSYIYWMQKKRFREVEETVLKLWTR